MPISVWRCRASPFLRLFLLRNPNFFFTFIDTFNDDIVVANRKSTAWAFSFPSLRMPPIISSMMKIKRTYDVRISIHRLFNRSIFISFLCLFICRLFFSRFGVVFTVGLYSFGRLDRITFDHKMIEIKNSFLLVNLLHQIILNNWNTQINFCFVFFSLWFLRIFYAFLFDWLKLKSK